MRFVSKEVPGFINYEEVHKYLDITALSILADYVGVQTT